MLWNTRMSETCFFCFLFEHLRAAEKRKQTLSYPDLWKLCFGTLLLDKQKRHQAFFLWYKARKKSSTFSTYYPIYNVYKNKKVSFEKIFLPKVALYWHKSADYQKLFFKARFARIVLEMRFFDLFSTTVMSVVNFSKIKECNSVLPL